MVNERSGTGKQRLALRALERYGDRSQLEWKVVTTTYPGHAAHLATEAHKQGLDAVVCVGGDGSVNEVGSALLGTPTRLAILPAGSGNGVALSLGIPRNYRRAVEVLNRFNSQTIDTGLLNGSIPFIGLAGIGFDAHIGSVFQHLEKRGFYAYISTVLKQYGSFQPHAVRIRVDDGDWMETRAFLICAANTSQYGNNAFIAPSADVFDGKLNFVVIDAFPRVSAPELIVRLFAGSILQSRHTRQFIGTRLEVEHGNLCAHVDGEPIDCQFRTVFEINPQKLRVVVPGGIGS